LLCNTYIAFLSKGDSGGPLFYYEKQVEPMLMGVVSAGNKRGGLSPLQYRHLLSGRKMDLNNLHIWAKIFL